MKEYGQNRTGSQRASLQERVPSILSKVKLLKGDQVLWLMVPIFMIISVLVVYSSSPKMGIGDSALHNSHHLISQFLIVFLGLGLMFMCYRVPCSMMRRLTALVYLVALVMMIIVLVGGSTTNGAARWINIFGFHFQPSELLKVATVMLVSRQLAKNAKVINNLRIVPSFLPWRWFTDPEQKKIWTTGTLPILGPIGISMIMILPAHTSSALLVGIVSFILLFIGRVRKMELLKLMLVGIALLCLYKVADLGRSETAGGRLSTWVHLWLDPWQNKPVREFTDTEKAMVAIHNGGIVGVGAGQSVTRAKMTHPESDYAFAFFVEEYGMIVGFFVVMMYVWIFVRAMQVARKCDWIYAQVLVVGLSLLIVTQAFLHIFVSLNLMPETGQTLPFISHGGSSMLCSCAALGMILSISRQTEDGTVLPAFKNV